MTLISVLSALTNTLHERDLTLLEARWRWQESLVSYVLFVSVLDNKSGKQVEAQRVFSEKFVETVVPAYVKQVEEHLFASIMKEVRECRLEAQVEEVLEGIGAL